MNFIYDIILNFTSNDIYYDFYEWKNDDNLVNFKKIPIFHVDSNFIDNFIYSEVVVDREFLKSIKGLTLVNKKLQNKYLHVCLLSNGFKTIGVRFNSKGKKIGISSMLIDEEYDCNQKALKIKKMKFAYKNNSIFNNKYILRDDYYKKKYLRKEIKKIYKNNNYSKLRYLYYDFFNELSDNYSFMYKKLINSLDNYTYKHNCLYNILKRDIKVK